MRIELLVVPGCPHETAAGALLRQALDDIGLTSQAFALITVGDVSTVDELRFLGSPTFIADGRDLFPEPGGTPALACRLYPGGNPLPPLPDLRRALKEAAAVTATR